MTQRRNTITVAFLTALAIVAGCVDGPTAPPEVEAALAKAKECPGHPSCGDGGEGEGGSQNYHITVTGDVTGDGETDHQTSGTVARGYQLDVSTFLTPMSEDFATCFDPSVTNGTSFSVGPTEANYFFDGQTTTGTGVVYGFKLLGGQTTASGPPAEGETVTITYSAWSVAHDSGGSKKTACSGSGSLSATVEVTGLPSGQ